MKSVLWILIHVGAAVIAAAAYLRSAKRDVEHMMSDEEKETTRECQLPRGNNAERGEH